jgi:NAD(P)-dependent dehydrogenase (short-subunit alcohol dehydrogenase family)
MGTQLAGQSALVTGGGSGIGRACAAALAADGAAVVIAGRTEAKLAVAAEAIGNGTSYVVCDVTSEDDVAAAVAQAATRGRLTMAIANAGFGTAAPLLMHDLASWNSVIATNLTGAMLTIKHAGAAIVANGGGSIVGISSIAGTHTHRFMSAYCVSKAGLEMLVRNAADELGVQGLRVNAVRPGLVPTDATEPLLTMTNVVNDYLAQMPLGRVGTDEEIAALVRFLLGPESGWITGACIPIDGGHHLRRGPWLDAS